jgi:hypothetical protein
MRLLKSKLIIPFIGFLALLLLLTPLSFAKDENGPVPPEPGGGEAPGNGQPSSTYTSPIDFTGIIPITIMIVIIFLALMRMLASAMASPQMSAWVKTEFRELIAGVLLVVIIYSFFFGSTSISAALTGRGDYIMASQIIIEDMLTNDTVGYDRAMHDIIFAGTQLRAAATYSPYLSIPAYWVGFTYSTAPMSGVGVLFSSLAQATQGLANVIIIYEGILMLIKFSSASVPPVLLPISISLRLIPFTRKIGNTLIAISLAAIVLLPFSVIIVGEMNKIIDYPEAYIDTWDKRRLDPGAVAMIVAEPFCQMMPVRFILSLNDLLFSLVVCLPFLFVPVVGGALFASCQPLVQNTIYPIMMMVMQIAYDLALLGWITAAQEGIEYANRSFDIIYPFLTQVNNLVLLGYLDAVIIGVITISGARSISGALGGEWYLGGIQRLI